MSFLVRRVGFRLVLLSVLVAAAATLRANGTSPQAVFEIAVDNDNSAATGCPVSFEEAGGVSVENGFERLFRITVDRGLAAVTVATTELADCDPMTGLFGAPAPIGGGWPVGLNNGVNGADVVEAEIPGGLIGNVNFQVKAGMASSPSIRLGLQSRTPAGGADALRMSANGGPLVFPPFGPEAIPTLSEWGAILLALFLVLAGLWLMGRRQSPSVRLVLTLAMAGVGVATLWAGSAIVTDGAVGDWAGQSPLASDAVGDAALGDPAADIVAVFVSQGSLFFRIDVRDLEQDPPAAADDTAFTDEDTPVVIDVLANDSDPDVVDSFTIQSVAPGPNGLVGVNPDMTLTFNPSANFAGIEIFSYTIVDDTGLTDSAQVSVTVAPVNDPPMAADDSATTDEDVAVDIDVLANDSDVEGPLTVIGFTQGANGSVSDQGGGILRYSPNSNFNGADSFTYTVQNGGADTDMATVDVTVNPVNDDPVGNPQSRTTPEDTPVMLTLTGSDVDGDTLTFSIMTGPANGTLGPVTQSPPTSATVTYTPDADFNGGDSFTFMVDDGNGGTGLATVDLTVGPENDPPTANPQMVNTSEDISLPIMLTGSDVDGDALTFTIVPMSGPSNGTLGAVTPVNDTTAMVTYTPDMDFNGADQFTFMVDDGNGSTDTATVDITVNPIQDSPTANPQTQTINEDTPVMLLLTGMDVDGDTLTFTIVPMSGPSNGSLGPITPMDATSATVTYTPDMDFNGVDSFEFQVDDGNGNTDTATVTINVDPVGDAPVARDDNVTTDEDTVLMGDVLADNGNGADSDAENDPITVTEVNGSAGDVGMQIALPSGALLTLNSDGTFNYDPNGQFESLAVGETGMDSFNYTISDGVSGSDTATVNVSLDGVNDPPTAADDEVATNSNAVLNGDVTVDNGNGADSDPDASDTLTVSEVNGNAGDVGMQIMLGSGALVTVNADGTFSYDPNGAFDSLPTGMTDTDSFMYSVSDGNGGSDTATVTVTVTGANDPPVAQDDLVSTDEDTPLMGDVTADNGNGADSDPDSDPLTITELNGSAMDIGTPVALASGAMLTLNSDGTFSYDPNGQFETLAPGQMAMDSFMYTLSDGNGGTDTATVTVTVTGVNDPPTDGDEGMAGAGAFATVGNTELVVESMAGQMAAGTGADFVTAAGNLLTNATDIDMPAMTLTVVPAVGMSSLGGDFQVFSDGSFTYVPPAGTTGVTDSFNYMVTDGTDNDVSTVYIDVGGIVWFVDNQIDAQNPVGGDGRSTDPFDTLGDFNAVNNGMAGNPAAGHRIFIYQGGGNYAGGLTLLDNQRATGHGAGLTEGGLTIAAASNPTLDDTLGDVVRIEDGNLVEGLTITAGANSAVVGNGDGGMTTLDDVGVSLSGSGTGIDLLNQSGTFTFSNSAITSSGAGSGTAVRINGGNAAVNFSGSPVNKSGGTGINILNIGGTVTFDNASTLTINGGNGADAVSLSSNTGTVNFNAGFAALNNANGRGLFANGGGTVNINSTTTAVNATGGAALDVRNTTLMTGAAAGWTFASLSSTGSPAEGIRLNNINQPVTVSNPGTGVSGAAGTSVLIDGGTGNFSYPGAIVNTAGRAVQVQNRTGGTVDLSGNVNEDGTGVLLNANTGSTLTFRGGMSLDTGANTAFTATGGGTVNVCATADCAAGAGVVNTIGAAGALTGTAVNIANTAIGASHVTFRSIDVNGGTPAVSVSATGSAGGFRVTGVDGPCGNTAMALDCDGGTIQNTTADAIVLNDTDGVSLSFMRLLNIGNMAGANDTLTGHDGIDATDVNGLTLTNVTVDSISDSGLKGTRVSNLSVLNSHFQNSNRYHLAGIADGTGSPEGTLFLRNLGGTNLIDNSVLENGAEHVDIENETVDLTLLTIQRSDFGATWKNTGPARLGKIGIDVVMRSAANATVHIGDPNESNAALGNSFLDARIASVRVTHFDGSSTGRIDAIVSRNNFAVSHTVPAIFDFACTGDQPQGGVAIVTRGNASARLDAIVSHNTFDHLQNADGRVGSLSILFDGPSGGVGQVRVSDNTFLFPYGATMDIADDGATGTVLVDNNTITGGPVSEPACFAGFPAPAQAINVYSQGDGGALHTVFRNTAIPTHDTGFDPGRGLRFRRENAGTHCVAVSNVAAVEGFQLRQTAGTFQLEQGASSSTDPATVMSDNGNTGTVDVTGTVTVVGPMNTAVCNRPSGGIF